MTEVNSWREKYIEKADTPLKQEALAFADKVVANFQSTVAVVGAAVSRELEVTVSGTIFKKVNVHEHVDSAEFETNKNTLEGLIAFIAYKGYLAGAEAPTE